MGKRSDKKKKRKRKQQQKSIIAAKSFPKTTPDNKAENSVKKNRKGESKTTDIIVTAAFPFVCVGYILIMATGFLDENKLYQDYMSLFMALFSLAISIFFSDFFSKRHDRFTELIQMKLGMTRNKKIYNLSKFLLSALFSFVLWYTMIKKPDYLDIPLVTRENVGNILTWLSIVIFSIDRSITNAIKDIR